MPTLTEILARLAVVPTTTALLGLAVTASPLDSADGLARLGPGAGGAVCARRAAAHACHPARDCTIRR